MIRRAARCGCRATGVLRRPPGVGSRALGAAETEFLVLARSATKGVTRVMSGKRLKALGVALALCGAALVVYDANIVWLASGVVLIVAGGFAYREGSKRSN